MSIPASSHRCLITYGASGRSITPEMCTENKLVDVDECYTLVQRDLKYTLLHARKRFVRSTITSFMCRMDEVFGIKSVAVFGYNAVSIGDEVDSHPGMKLITAFLREDSKNLECWTFSGDVRKHKRGLLYSQLPGLDVREMTRAQLLIHIKELNEVIKEIRIRNDELELLEIESGELRRENNELRENLETLEEMFIRGGRQSELASRSATLNNGR